MTHLRSSSVSDPFPAQQAFDAGDLPDQAVLARDIMRDSFPTIAPEETLADAVERMQKNNVDRILVLDPLARQQLVGIVTRGDILSIYRRLFQ